MAASVEGAHEAVRAAHRDEVADVREVDVGGERGGGVGGDGEAVRKPEQVRGDGELVDEALAGRGGEGVDGAAADGGRPRPGEGRAGEALDRAGEAGEPERGAGGGGDGAGEREDVRARAGDVGEVAPRRGEGRRAGDGHDLVERQGDGDDGALADGRRGDGGIDVQERGAGGDGLEAHDDGLGLPFVVVAPGGGEAEAERGDVGGDGEASVGGAAVRVEALHDEVADAVALVAPRQGCAAVVVGGDDGEGVVPEVRVLAAVLVLEAGHVAGVPGRAGVAVAGAARGRVAAGGLVDENLDVLVAVVHLRRLEVDEHAQVRAAGREVVMRDGR